MRNLIHFQYLPTFPCVCVCVFVFRSAKIIAKQYEIFIHYGMIVSPFFRKHFSSRIVHSALTFYILKKKKKWEKLLFMNYKRLNVVHRT